MQRERKKRTKKEKREDERRKTALVSVLSDGSSLTGEDDRGDRNHYFSNFRAQKGMD